MKRIQKKFLYFLGGLMIGVIFPLIIISSPVELDSDSNWLSFMTGYFGAIIGGLFAGLFTFLGIRFDIKERRRTEFKDKIIEKLREVNNLQHNLLHIYKHTSEISSGLEVTYISDGFLDLQNSYESYKLLDNNLKQSDYENPLQSINNSLQKIGGKSGYQLFTDINKTRLILADSLFELSQLFKLDDEELTKLNNELHSLMEDCEHYKSNKHIYEKKNGELKSTPKVYQIISMLDEYNSEVKKVVDYKLEIGSSNTLGDYIEIVNDFNIERRNKINEFEEELKKDNDFNSTDIEADFINMLYSYKRFLEVNKPYISLIVLSKVFKYFLLETDELTKSLEETFMKLTKEDDTLLY